ncbi:hypothetical protein [Streptomyces himalayensis]|uniref:Transposase n=1 Tax=Streptomyces himalayensis subsp. himalayensis TaxID=2756131 RepID=A0A7W0DUY2_9ACTN|nr:hypothetical protein [Streptomyces himalayensis]MBA2951773.1 hypothetical protein [Streptomyces himalayensis subsp. himalayensis]
MALPDARLPAVHRRAYYYLGKWCDDGADQVIHDLLRWQVRERRGRCEDPSAIVMDTQTVHASVNAAKATTGLDPGKKSRGRKRGITTDILSLLIELGAACAVRKLVAAGQAVYLYSLITPPSTRVRKSR